MIKMPFVTVIIVNYNGAHYLPFCLSALKNQTYPFDRFEVIVSDNGSTDNSIETIHRDYPWVNILENEKNLGYTGGNNQAIKTVSSQYVILLNNDTAPNSNWLENLVNAALKNPTAGIITSKLLLFYNELRLDIESESFVPEGDGRELGVQLYGLDTSTKFGTVQYLDGWHGWETASSGDRFRWSKGKATLGTPIPKEDGDWTIKIKLAASRTDQKAIPVSIKQGGHTLATWSVQGGSPKTHTVTIPANARTAAVQLIQNAGSHIYWDGNGRDRGTYVKNHESFYEIDAGQYDNVDEIFGGCGAAMLLRKTMLDEIGLFDDDFFVYYEDTDLSWRARLAGWKVFYEPNAIVRHIHSGTSIEWSPFFTYHVYRNRLVMLAKNGVFSQILSAWLGYILATFKAILRVCLNRVNNRIHVYVSPKMAILQLRVLWNLLRWVPSILRKRNHIQRNRKLEPIELANWFIREDKA